MAGDPSSTRPTEAVVAAFLDTVAPLRGPHRLGTGCVYLKDLDDVDLDVLAEIVRRSYATLTAGPTFGRRLSGPGAGPPGGTVP
ncbi:hypothetical protein [Luteimicrobium album]|nr:hypothetical protein [Luteimicrobium album]